MRIVETNEKDYVELMKAWTEWTAAELKSVRFRHKLLATQVISQMIMLRYHPQLRGNRLSYREGKIYVPPRTGPKPEDNSIEQVHVATNESCFFLDTLAKRNQKLKIRETTLTANMRMKEQDFWKQAYRLLPELADGGMWKFDPSTGKFTEAQQQ